MSNESKNYWQNFSALKDVVAQIESMNEPDVDQLVSLVDAGMVAKKACIARIEAVEKMLGIEHAAEPQ